MMMIADDDEYKSDYFFQFTQSNLNLEIFIFRNAEIDLKKV